MQNGGSSVDMLTEISLYACLAPLFLPMYWSQHTKHSRPKISLGMSLHSLKSSLFFFFSCIFSQNSPPEKVIFSHRKLFLNTNLFNT